MSKSTSVRKWLPLLCLLALADVTATFESMMVVSALPTLVREFGDPVGVGWLMSAHYLAYAATVAIVGRLGDLYGHKRLLVFVLGVVFLGSVLAAIAPTLEWIIAGRLLQGVAGGILPLSLAIVRNSVPHERQSLSVGVLLAASGVGAATGMIVGGFIIDNGTWQHLFIFSALLAIVMLVAIAILLPASPVVPTKRRLDLIGGTLFVPAVAALLIAISNLDAWGPGDMRFIGLVAAGLTIGVIWAVYEWRHPDPMLNVRLFAQKDFALLTMCIALLGLSGFQTSMILMLLLQQPIWTGVGLGLTATFAAILKLPSNVASSIFSPLIGHLFGRFGARNVLITGFTLAGAGWSLLIIENHSLWFVVATITLAANLGTAVVFVGATAGIMEASPPGRTGEAQGMFAVVRSIFISAGAQLVMIILASDTVRSTGAQTGVYPSEFAYVALFGALVFISILGIILALFLSRLNPTGQSARGDEADAEPRSQGGALQHLAVVEAGITSLRNGSQKRNILGQYRREEV